MQLEAADPAPTGAFDQRSFEWLRDGVFKEGITGFEDAKFLVALEREGFAAGDPQIAEWADFLIGGVGAFLCSIEPADDRWPYLCKLVFEKDRVATPVLFDLLVTVMENSASVPTEVAAQALGEVSRAVIEGSGPLAFVGEKRGIVSSWHVDILRTVLLAAENREAPSVSRVEMETLVALNEASDRVQNAPEWNDLFVKAAANYVLSDRADLNQPRAVALAPAREGGSESARASRGVLASLDHMARAGIPSNDPGRILARKRERGIEAAIEENAGVMAQCLTLLQEQARAA